MKLLTYNPENLSYEVAPSLKDRKVAVIQDINILQQHLGKGPLSLTQFNAMMEMELDELTRIINDQASALERAKAKLL